MAADDDLTQLLKQYYGVGSPDYFSQTDTEARYPPKEAFPGDPSLYQGEIRNSADRPSDPVAQRVAEALSPTMGAYGLGQTAADAITKASDPLGPDYSEVAKYGLPLLGIFAGPGAKTADLAALAKAHEMAGKAIDRGQIWNDTGWFQGADDKWRHEIPDDQAYYAAKGYQGGINGDKILPEVLGHKDLYKAYPDMKGIAAAWKTGPSATEEILSGGPKAGYGEHTQLGEFIAGLGHNKEDLLSSFLHEAQHAIQSRENFAPGGNNEMFTPEQIAAERDRLFHNPSFAEDNPDLSSDQKLAFDMYQRLAGEVEARNVQRRQMYTPEMRRLIPPWETQDTPYEQQINSTPMFNVEKSHAYSVPQEAGKGATAGPQAGYPGDQSPALPGQVEPQEVKTIDQILRETYGSGRQMSVDKDSSVSGNPSEQVDTSRPLTSNSVGVGNFDLTTPGIREQKIGNSTLMYQVGEDGSVKINSVRTPQAKRGAGSARSAMQDFLASADAQGIPVKLDASPLDRKTSTAGLVNFYKSLGFEETGRSINPVGDPEMVRAPMPDRTYPGDSTSNDVGVGLLPSERAAAYGLPTKGYHGTLNDFTDFQVNPDYMLDRGLGVHFAKDPEVSNSFVMDRVNGNEIGPKEGGRIIQGYLPDEKDMLEVHQPVYDAYKDMPNRKPNQGIKSDQYAIENMVAMEGYRKDPAMLARYLTEARHIPEEQAVPMAQQLAAGKSVMLPDSDKPYDLARFVDNYGGKPFNDADRKRITEVARQSWIDQGYKGLKYINTSPMEMATAKDPTSYIVFDPKNIRASGAKFDPAKKESTNFMHAFGGKVSR